MSGSITGGDELSIEKLELVCVIGEQQSLDDAISACLQSKVFHMEDAGKLLGSLGGTSAGESSGAEDNPYEEPLRHLAELDLQRAAINIAKEPLPAEFTVEQLNAEISRISESLHTVQETLRVKHRQIAELRSTMIHLRYLGDADIDLGVLTGCKHILYRFGRMPEENAQKLTFYNDERFIFRGYHTESEYVWGFYFAEAEQIAHADAMMKALLFESFELPVHISGTPQEALSSMQKRLEDTETEAKRLEDEMQQIYTRESDLIGRMYRFAKYQSAVHKLRSRCVRMRGKFTLMGYVPLAEKPQFRKIIDRVPGLTVTYENPSANPTVQPPVRMKNGWFSRPFAMFVEMYGLPSHSGFNPTTLLAITYTLMFGLMFGDLGQGILLALIGLFLDKKKHFPLGGIMTRIGVSSAVFGALYGSVFGFEELLDPFYEKLGIPFLPLKAMENTNLIIFGAVGLGAVIIIVSILVNIVVRLRQKRYDEAVFGNNGIAGLVFFCALLLIVIGILTGRSFLNAPFVLGLIVLPLLLMFFREPLGALLGRRHYEMPPLGDFIASNFFECFEFLLGYATNTLSFIRVGGFVFSHAGLMSVVMLLADMAGGGAMPVVIVIGNLFVMCLEGLIVGIQVLRLEFYEVFSRCYDGDGRVFTPIAVTFDEVTDHRQSDETASV